MMMSQSIDHIIVAKLKDFLKSKNTTETELKFSSVTEGIDIFIKLARSYGKMAANREADKMLKVLLDITSNLADKEQYNEAIKMIDETLSRLEKGGGQ
jgi:hypothetical protein